MRKDVTLNHLIYAHFAQWKWRWIWRPGMNKYEKNGIRIALEEIKKN
jgi:hypothetical protein